MKRILGLLLVLTLLLGMVSVASAEKTKIVFWALDHGTTRNTFIEGLVNDYNAREDCAYEVELTWFDETSYRQRLAAARAGSTMCDIFMNNYGNIPTDCNNQYALPLDDLLPKEVIDDITAKALVTYRDGKIYGYPMYVEPCTVAYYNKEMFAAAGIEEFPKTWAEFLEVMPKLTNEFVYGSHFMEGVWDNCYNQTAEHYLLNDDWTAANCQDQGYVDFLTFIKALYDGGYVPQQNLYSQAEGWRAVATEACATAFSGSWGVDSLIRDYPDMLDVIGIASFPAPTADSVWHTTTGGWAWLIDSKTKVAEGAADFIAWSIGGDPERMAQLYIDLNFSTYSPRASVNAILDKYADEHAGEFAVDAMRYISQNIVPNCVGEPIYSIDITVTYWITMQQVMWNGMSPEDALADCAEKINTYLKNNEYWQYCP